MNLQDQVCTQDQSVRLDQLRVLQKSAFWFYPDGKLVYADTDYAQALRQIKHCVSAFSVAELGIMIGSGYYTYHHEAGNYTCWGSDEESILYKEFYSTEAQARAALLIHLIENKIVEVSEINNRLNK